MKSEQAQVAAIIRKALKAHGIKCSVKSRSFSMGDAVDVKVFDQMPAAMALIESEFSKYQYGRFNGMEDIYEYSNTNGDIPQTKFLHINNVISSELKQKAWDWTRATFGGFDNSPADYSDIHNHDDYTAVNRTLSDSKGGFWFTVKPRQKAA